MLYNILNQFLHNNFNLCFCNILLIRTFLSFLFSFIFTIIGIKYLISYLKNHNAFQPIRVEGPEGHLITKQKTPTMGGLITNIALLFCGLLFTNIKDINIIATLIISLSFGLIGFIDDYIKIFKKDTRGFKGSIKLILQITIIGFVVLWLIYSGSSIIDEQTVFIPYIKYSLYIGVLFIPFIMLVVVGSTNAVNLTDGLDGLAIIPIMICAFIFGIISFYTINNNVNPVVMITDENLAELIVLCGSIIGGGIGFFIYNKHPAKIFMGDVGALMYGAFLGIVAVLLRHEVFYGIAGLLFVIEALSVIIQVTSYKLIKKRVFLMAPIHHHFEKLGWSERKVVLSFWCFSIFCLIIALLGIIKF